MIYYSNVLKLTLSEVAHAATKGMSNIPRMLVAAIVEELELTEINALTLTCGVRV